MSFIKRHVNSNTSYFVPKYPEKYKGKKTDPIIVRSTWERQFMQWLDLNPSILSWGSETISIPYFNPVKGCQARYYPDFICNIYTKDKKEKVYLVEIKPKKETLPPKKTKTKADKTYLTEQRAYAINQAKWRAAKEYCKKYNMDFMILTEKDLFK